MEKLNAEQIEKLEEMLHHFAEWHLHKKGEGIGEETHVEALGLSLYQRLQRAQIITSLLLDLGFNKNDFDRFEEVYQCDLLAEARIVAVHDMKAWPQKLERNTDFLRRVRELR